MAVDKKLEVVYDLTSINEDQASQLIKANEDVIKKAKSQKKKKPTTQSQLEKETKKGNKEKEKKLKAEEREKKRKEKEGKDFKNFIKSNSQNLSGFVMSTLKTSLPQLGAILGLTAIITTILKRINEIQSKFTENVDERINIALSDREQARVDANLQQIILTNGDGSNNPRNQYNSLNESDANITLTETNFRLDNISGYE